MYKYYLVILAAFEISTRVQGGEDEKYKILEKELLQPLNNLCLSTDRYTQEHATEAIAELLTLPEIQVSNHSIPHHQNRVFRSTTWRYVTLQQSLQSLSIRLHQKLDWKLSMRSHI